jgi:hypothetical protein
MSDKTYAIFTTLIGLVCGYVVIHRLFFVDSLTLRNALIQGFLVGLGLAVVTVEILARINATRINAWITVFGCGLPDNARVALCHTKPAQ